MPDELWLFLIVKTFNLGLAFDFDFRTNKYVPVPAYPGQLPLLSHCINFEVLRLKPEPFTLFK